MTESAAAPAPPVTPAQPPDADPSTYHYADPRAVVAASEGRRTPVHFDSHGVRVAGHAYVPPNAQAPFPALVLIGPETYVKEQVPAEYARRLADRGFLALTFDPRGRGESDAAPGAPRDVESPLGKVADVRAALDYLSTRRDVDRDRLFAVAICQGSSEMVRAVADEAAAGNRVKAVATLAGHYRDHDGDVQWFGGEDRLAARKARAADARRKYEATGEVDYVKGVDPHDPNVGMPGELVWGWYQRWADAGLWPNRFAVLSDDELLAYESMSASARLAVPYLMFHSTQCMLPDAARRHFDLVPGEKRAEWWGDTLHFQFYDDPRVIDRAAPMIADWFRRHMPAHGAAAGAA